MFYIYQSHRQYILRKLYSENLTVTFKCILLVVVLCSGRQFENKCRLIIFHNVYVHLLWYDYAGFFAESTLISLNSGLNNVTNARRQIVTWITVIGVRNFKFHISWRYHSSEILWLIHVASCVVSQTLRPMTSGIGKRLFTSLKDNICSTWRCSRYKNVCLWEHPCPIWIHNFHIYVYVYVSQSILVKLPLNT